MSSPQDRHGRIEARAEIRTFARALREMHAALVQEGFTEGQAMQIIGVALAAGIASGGER